MAQALRFEARELHTQKDYKGALDLFTKAIDLDNRNPELFGDRLAVYLQLGEVEKALIDGNRAVEVSSSTLDTIIARFSLIGRLSLVPRGRMVMSSLQTCMNAVVSFTCSLQTYSHSCSRL